MNTLTDSAPSRSRYEEVRAVPQQQETVSSLLAENEKRIYEIAQLAESLADKVAGIIPEVAENQKSGEPPTSDIRAHLSRQRRILQTIWQELNRANCAIE